MEEAGIPGRDNYDLPDSEKRFPDGAHYRIEMSGVEGPEVLEALIDEKNKRNVPVHRLISLVGGGYLYDDEEIKYFAQMAADEEMVVIVEDNFFLLKECVQECSIEALMNLETL